MKIPEKKTLAYKNPEHSDRDVKAQLIELEKAICDSLDLPKKKVVGQYMGKNVYEGDIKFDPEKNVYVIDLKDGSVAEVDPKNFSYSAENEFDKWRREYGGTRVADAKAIYGVASDSRRVDPLRARVEAAGSYVMPPVGPAAKLKANKLYSLDGMGARVFDPSKAAVKVSLGTASHASAPWDDPLKDMIDKANNTVACCDLPNWRESSESSDTNAKMQVYYHDRFPSIKVRDIVNDAILMLQAKKNLNISLHSFIQTGDEWRMIYKVVKDKFPPEKETKIIECIFTKKAFDRMTSQIDKHAKLKARLDTNTFLKLRIAYLLYEAQKLGKRDFQHVCLDVFRIVGISTHPHFDF